jgi:hypothetical protein
VAINRYPTDQAWRQATATFALLLGVLVMFAAMVLLGWWLWEFVIDNPMPYRDPEATRADRLYRLAVR